MVKKTIEQQKVIDNLNFFGNSREQVINFLKDYTEMLSDANCKTKKIIQVVKDLKY